jgi:hypothetical protein
VRSALRASGLQSPKFRHPNASENALLVCQQTYDFPFQVLSQAGHGQSLLGHRRRQKSVSQFLYEHVSSKVPFPALPGQIFTLSTCPSLPHQGQISTSATLKHDLRYSVFLGLLHKEAYLAVFFLSITREISQKYFNIFISFYLTSPPNHLNTV